MKDIVFGDILDGATILSNLAKATGLKEGPPNWAETAWAAGGLAMNLIPGVAIIKKAYGAVGRIAARLGKNSRFGDLLSNRLTKEAKADRNLTAYASRGEEAFVKRLDEDTVLMHKLDSPDANDAYIAACVKLDKEIGDPLWSKIKTMPATPAEVQKVVEAIGDSSPEALNLLKAGGKVSGNNLNAAIDGVHAAVKDGHSPEVLQRVLNNVELDTPNYNQVAPSYNRVDLLSDLGRADVDGTKLAEVSGAKKLVDRLWKKGQVKGFKFELQAAADLQKQGYAIEFLGKKTSFAKETYNPGGKFKEYLETDLDIIARKGGQLFNVQAKSSARALNGPPPSEAVRRLHNWIGAAIKKDGKDSVKIMVPPGVDRAPHIEKVLVGYGLDWDSIRVFSSTP